MTITKDMTMGEVLEKDPGIGMVLMQCGMHCVGCPSHSGETLEVGCLVHGLNVDDVMAEIEAYLASKQG